MGKFVRLPNVLYYERTEVPITKKLGLTYGVESFVPVDKLSLLRISPTHVEFSVKLDSLDKPVHMHVVGEFIVGDDVCLR